MKLRVLKSHYGEMKVRQFLKKPFLIDHMPTSLIDACTTKTMHKLKVEACRDTLAVVLYLPAMVSNDVVEKLKNGQLKPR